MGLRARRLIAEDATRPSDRLAMGSVLGGALVVAAVLVARVGFGSPVAKVNVNALSENGDAPRVTSGHVASAGAPVEAVQPTIAPAKPTAAPSSDERRQVAHTERVGVVLRASPRDTDWTPRGFMDGAKVTVLERSDADWVRVRGDNGQEGWVPARYITQ